MLSFYRWALVKVTYIVSETNVFQPFTASFLRHKIISSQLRGETKPSIPDVLIVPQKLEPSLYLIQVIAFRFDKLGPIISPHLILLPRLLLLEIRYLGGFRFFREIVIRLVDLIERIFFYCFCNVFEEIFIQILTFGLLKVRSEGSPEFKVLSRWDIAETFLWDFDLLQINRVSFWLLIELYWRRDMM